MTVFTLKVLALTKSNSYPAGEWVDGIFRNLGMSQDIYFLLPIIPGEPRRRLALDYNEKENAAAQELYNGSKT